MRCRRCKRTIQGCFLSLSFSQNMDGKRENRQDPRKPEDLLIFLLLSRSMTLAKDIGRSASRCRKRVHHLIHRVQMMLFLWADYKLHINGGNLMKKRTVSVLLTTCLAAGMLAGCGSTSADTTATPDKTTEETTNETEKDRSGRSFPENILFIFHIRAGRSRIRRTGLQERWMD